MLRIIIHNYARKRVVCNINEILVECHCVQKGMMCLVFLSLQKTGIH